MKPAPWHAGALLCLVLATRPCVAGESAADATVYAYASTTERRADSVLNPDNTVARLAQYSGTLELRLGLKYEDDALRLTARPIVLRDVTQLAAPSGDERATHDEAYLSLWQARLKLAEAWHIAVGRDVLNWGPAQFRSPSSPYYFDNGRSDPQRELSGMDVAKLSWTPDRQTTVTMARVQDSGHQAQAPDPWRDSWLFKIDRRGADWAYGWVAAQANQRGAFYGAHAQLTASDAWLIYGEIGSSPAPSALELTSTDAFSFATPAPRRTTALIGAAYTREGGDTLTAEYLHDGRGYTRTQTAAYFNLATQQPAIALAGQPPLLGRDYAYLVWQSNLLDEAGFWRLMYTRNLTDGSTQYAVYGESTVSPHLSVFAFAALPHGDARQEFSSLLRATLTLGVKFPLP